LSQIGKIKMDRKRFFQNLGKGALFVALLKAFPLKFFNNVNRNAKKVKVKIHPSAIKRNK